ncbi:hypothetical protein EUX98_g6449 [Antrodiella citrinella]|uniref:Uncharacterized protein n=1 Tax=Antrodiella citrinella TaxID=2447956 RepID=A0A4S4MPS0_9APHY|nr:hypothetical protein EUX98_g6449 [Antrodiella citrinella]
MGLALTDLHSSSNDAFKFPKLNGTNYAEWKTQMKAALQAKYIWLLVEGIDAAPSDPGVRPTVTDPKDVVTLATWKVDHKEYMEWIKNDQAAQGLMKGAAEPSQWPHVVSATTATAMWNAWKKVHQDDLQVINVHYYFEELFTLKFVDGMSMPDHVARIFDLRNRLMHRTGS